MSEEINKSQIENLREMKRVIDEKIAQTEKASAARAAQTEKVEDASRIPAHLRPPAIVGNSAAVSPSENADNWKHRSMKMVCETCMWFSPKALKTGAQSRLGRCRRNAPTMGGFPAVYLTDWCGRHKLNEEKA